EAAPQPDAPGAPVAVAAAAAPAGVIAPPPAVAAPALAGGWGDLAFGDLDLDPNTGKAVERAADSDDVRQRRQLAVQPAPAPVSVAVELAQDDIGTPEAPAIEMTPLPLPAPIAAPDDGDDAASPWDGPSGLTEPVDLDVSPMGPSAMDLVLAGTARRPHAD